MKKPPLWRLSVLLVVGLILMMWAGRLVQSCRPSEVPDTVARDGIRRIYEVIDVVRNSTFGRSYRGNVLTASALKMMAAGNIKFSPNLAQEALYRKEVGRSPVLYISVFVRNDRVMWPLPEELAERIYHESLHAAIQTENHSRQEECDAYCAAEEAAAVVAGRSPRLPVMRDGKPVWEWVQDAYSTYPSDKSYLPVGYTLTELAARTENPVNLPNRLAPAAAR